MTQVTTVSIPRRYALPNHRGAQTASRGGGGTGCQSRSDDSTTATFHSFAAKIGSATSLNQTDFITSSGQRTPVAGAGLQTFAFTFVPGSDPAAGIAFKIYAGCNAGNPTTVCIDNVYLGTPN